MLSLITKLLGGGGKKSTFASISRYHHNPIIRSDADIPWRSLQTFNPAALLLDNRVHLLYRAIGADGVSRFGYANSLSGFQVDELPDEVAYRERNEDARYTVCSIHSGGSFAGCEDSRLVYIEEDGRVYLTYTSCADGLRMAISSISVENFIARRWDAWSRPRFMSPPGEVHKNWVLFPEKINGRYAICHSLSPLSIAYLDTLDFEDCIHSRFVPSKPSERWDSYMRGAGPPPIRIDEGWLLFYHAMSHTDMSQYKIGAMILDHDDPMKVLYRSSRPVLAPTDVYEFEGYKGGVVYASGLVVKGDTLLLYYGAADSFVCVAYADLRRFVSELKHGGRVRLSRAPLMRRMFSRLLGGV